MQLRGRRRQAQAPVHQYGSVEPRRVQPVLAGRGHVRRQPVVGDREARRNTRRLAGPHPRSTYAPREARGGAAVVGVGCRCAHPRDSPDRTPDSSTRLQPPPGALLSRTSLLSPSPPPPSLSLPSPPRTRSLSLSPPVRSRISFKRRSLVNREPWWCQRLRQRTRRGRPEHADGANFTAVVSNLRATEGVRTPRASVFPAGRSRTNSPLETRQSASAHDDPVLRALCRIRGSAHLRGRRCRRRGARRYRRRRLRPHTSPVRRRPRPEIHPRHQCRNHRRKWHHATGGPWCYMTWAVASRGGHVECMEWLHANGCQ